MLLMRWHVSPTCFAAPRPAHGKKIFEAEPLARSAHALSWEGYRLVVAVGRCDFLDGRALSKEGCWKLLAVGRVVFCRGAWLGFTGRFGAWLGFTGVLGGGGAWLGFTGRLGAWLGFTGVFGGGEVLVVRFLQPLLHFVWRAPGGGFGL